MHLIFAVMCRAKDGMLIASGALPPATCLFPTISGDFISFFTWLLDALVSKSSNFPSRWQTEGRQNP